MGIGGISIWQLLIILLIVMMLFGTKRLRGLGSDLGAAIKGFKNSVTSDDGDKDDAEKTEGEDAGEPVKRESAEGESGAQPEEQDTRTS